MSKVSIRSGIEVPFTLARDAMFILHGRDEKDVLGIYVGNKGDEPVCVQNLRVVFNDDNSYQILPHDKLVCLDGVNQKLTLPDPEKLNNGHEIRVLSVHPQAGEFIKNHDGTDTDIWMGMMTSPLHLLYNRHSNTWIEL